MEMCNELLDSVQLAQDETYLDAGRPGVVGGQARSGGLAWLLC